MPKSKNIHSKIDNILLGYTIPDVHTIMDIASKSMGAGHRIVGHSTVMLDFMENIFGVKGRNIALLHILLDANIIDRKIVENIIKQPLNQ